MQQLFKYCAGIVPQINKNIFNANASPLFRAKLQLNPRPKSKHAILQYHLAFPNDARQYETPRAYRASVRAHVLREKYGVAEKAEEIRDCRPQHTQGQVR